jgi:hypothetical protein
LLTMVECEKTILENKLFYFKNRFICLQQALGLAGCKVINIEYIVSIIDSVNNLFDHVK